MLAQATALAAQNLWERFVSIEDGRVAALLVGVATLCAAVPLWRYFLGPWVMGSRRRG